MGDDPAKRSIDPARGVADLWAPLTRELASGSDRSFAIVASQMLDQLLRNALAARLSPSAESEDRLLDTPDAPINTFSARIHLAKRIGLITIRFARDLHLIRKIRNEFAHSFEELTFDQSPMRDFVRQLAASHAMADRDPGLRGRNMRHEFYIATSWVALQLEFLVKEARPFPEPKPEWGYTHEFRDRAAPPDGRT